MTFLKWDKQYQLNISLIDKQHKRLFLLIDNFYQALKQKQSKQGMAELLNGLAEYTIYHFNAEEWFMKLYKYPVHQQHKAAHKEFIENVQDFQTRFEQGRLLIPLEVANFLKDWLSNHILTADKQLALFLIQKGVL
ncbi:bacteriohemerythrin [Desulfococcaceae bacterium HSG7]|nr:bacteriohemerythrin [Desulfococcaceae bacterium HSG7]